MPKCNNLTFFILNKNKNKPKNLKIFIKKYTKINNSYN